MFNLVNKCCGAYLEVLIVCNDANYRGAVDSFILIDRLLICLEVNDWWELVT